LKRLLVALAMVPVLLAPQSGCAQAPAKDTSPQQPAPTIEFLSPHANDKISDYPIYIETKVNNCSLAVPVQYWSQVERAYGNIGHIHYTLDDAPIFATRSTKVVMTKPTGKSLPIGKHILRAELVYINHANRNPRIFAEVPIYCERPQQKTASESSDGIPMDDRTRQELKELEKKLTQVQQELSQLKAHARDVPNP